MTQNTLEGLYHISLTNTLYLQRQMNLHYKNLARLGNHLSFFNITSLLRRLQEQTLTNATQPIGKIQHFRKIAVTKDAILMCFGI